MTTVEPRLYQGVRDVLPSELLPRNDLLRKLTAVFERFGFAPLETPAMEFLDILVGKYGEEGEKLLYRVERKGDGDALALRYDLTVPLARMVAMHPELPLPFKRYQVQPVWRADRPQPAQGRFREFYQCDVDTVGTASLLADAENVAVVHEGILALGLDAFFVKVNDRRILKGVARYAGVPEGREAEVFRALDKLDKIGTEGVRAELETLGFGGSVVDRLFAATAAAGSPEATLKALETTLIDDAEARVGVDALREVLEGAVALGAAQKRLVVDPTLTRGLDYYTGPVYEVVLDVEEKFGSLGGGGRYDDLMSLFSDKKTPATGVSIGLTRVLSALLKFDLLKPRPSPTEAMVLRLPDAPVGELLRLVSDLRARGVATELYYEPDRLKKQFAYAEKKGVRFALVAGATELSEGIVQVKTLATGEQVPTPRADVAAYVEARRKA